MKYMTAAFLVFFTCLAAGPLQAQTNLLHNGGFEKETLGQLDFWQMDSFRDTDEARRVFTVEKPSRSGKHSLVIVNLLPNDTRVVQWLAVEPDSYYRITCWVMAEKVSQGAIGANISILGSIIPSTDVKDTRDRWRRLELVGKTGPNQDALAVALRLGFYDNLVTGRAYFDDAEAEKISAPPAGMKVVDFFSNRGIGVIQNEPKGVFAEWAGEGDVNLYLAGGAAVILVLALFLSFLAAILRKRRPPCDDQNQVAASPPTTVTSMERAHRKALRINITVKKQLSNDNYRLIEVKSVNISSTGILLSSDDLSLFNVGERLELTAVYKRKKYGLGAARVVRKQETHQGKGPAIRTGFGLVFVDSDKEALKNIKMISA